MFKIADLQTCLKEQVGFRQTENPEYAYIDEALTVSSSGLYVNDFHPLLSNENLDSLAKDYKGFIYPVYTIVEPYKKGHRVNYAGNIYLSLQNNNLNHTPDVSPLWWTKIDPLSFMLEERRAAAIGKVISATMQQKKLAGTTKAIFENVRFFEGAGRFQNKEIKLGRFVFFEIKLKRQIGLTAVIDKIGLQLDTAQMLDIYLFHSSSLDPLKTFELNIDAPVSFSWKAISDCILSYLSDNHDAGGSFYLGYFEDDLTGQAIIKDGFDFSAKPCASCNSRNYAYYNIWNQFFEIHPGYVQAADLNGVQLWDIEKNRYVYSTNWGMNLNFSVKCDLTNIFCSQKEIFADAIYKQTAVDLLELIAYSVRNNAIAEKTRSLALFALDNRENGSVGARKELQNAINALSFDFSDLNSSCLPCNQSKGVRHTAI